MSIDRNTAHANSKAALDAKLQAGDTNFIADVDGQITAACAQGHFEVTALTSLNVSIINVYTYYTNLGYNVYFPDYANQNGQTLPSIINNPSNFFGYNWVQYWLRAITLYRITNPARITVGWRSYSPPANPEGPV
jgi:hypothetical protein